MYPEEVDARDAGKLPARPPFPAWALPPRLRPKPEWSPWAEVTPELLRDLLDGLEAL